MATMTLSAQEVCFLVLFSKLSTERRELMRSLLRELVAANQELAAVGGAQ